MSFSQEMKDFIGAYEKGQKINASRTDQDYKEQLTSSAKSKETRDNDPETLELAAQQARATLAVTQDRLKSSAASRAHTGASTALLQDRLKQSRAGGAGYGGIGLAQDGYSGAINPGSSGPQPMPGGALPIPPSSLDDGRQEFADGGLVPEEDDEEEPLVGPDAGEMGAVPINAPMAPPAAPPASTDVSARRREPGVPKGLEGVISPALVHDATKAGMMFGINEYGLKDAGAVRTPASQAKARLFAQGHGGLSDQEMQMAKKAVDPEGKLTESQRNMAALGSVYQFYANKGEGPKAEKVAFQMLQHYRNAAQRYAAISAKAAEGGNVDLATKAAMKAYANVPDGNDLELMVNPDGGIMYAVTGPDGEVVNKGIATPQQLAASAMGLASGGFDKAILAAAGAREAPKEAVKTGGKPQSAADRKAEAELPAAEIEKMKTKWQEKNKDAPADEEMWSEATNTAQHLMQQNKNMNASEAARAAHAMLVPTGDLEKLPYKVKPGEEGQPNTITFGKLKFQVDEDQMESIRNSRAARVKALDDKSWEDAEKANSPGRMDQAVEGAKQVGRGVDAYVQGGGAPGAVMGLSKRIGETAASALKSIYGEHIPQSVVDAVEATKGAVGGAVDAGAKAVGGAFANKGAIPLDDNDRPL